MAKRKNKKEVVEELVETVEPVAEVPAVEVPVVEAPVAEVPAEAKKWIVNCHRCGASLYVEISNVVYMCPVCNNLLRVRKCEKLVKDVTRNIVAEAYVNVQKGADEK